MKQCKVLIELIAESKDKKKGPKTDKKVAHMEREEERDPKVEMMVRRRSTKEVSIKEILLEEGTEDKWLLSGEKLELLR